MTSEQNKLIGERVRHFRKALCLTMEELGGKISRPITMQQVSKYELGLDRWPADTLAEVAKILHVPVPILLGRIAPERASTEELEIEYYKTIILKMRPKTREVLYKVIEGVSKL